MILYGESDFSSIEKVRRYLMSNFNSKSIGSTVKCDRPHQTLISNFSQYSNSNLYQADYTIAIIVKCDQI